ncbi:14440_t:CDS:1 [Dentiscutata heterogama]|uniref:14440_t:CDS:1 n=1 Tax=Dentiscutata heterogama TaxID=1316150 RepID=A0ACA9LUU1_9GLOM|nr:14440_t:CDS:1 [Dentiscutata heterogama]
MKNVTTIDIPPTYPTFGMTNAIKPKIHNQTTTQQLPIPTMSTNMLLSIPAMLPGFNPFMYPYTIPTPLYQQPPQNTSKCNITLKEFFNELDQLHNSNGVYTAFTEFFKEYEILVDHIKYLTDD